jgi:hypothetical protein
MRASDVDECLRRLTEWDKQLEGAQVFMEKQIVERCNQNIVDNYQRQIQEDKEMAKKRDQVIQEMNNQHDQ